MWRIVIAVDQQQVTDAFSTIEKAYRGSDNTFGMALTCLAFVAILAYVVQRHS